MFEHLGHIPETTLRKKRSKSKAYASFLFGALLVFTFSLSISDGPSSVAQEYANPRAEVFVDGTQRSMAVGNPSFPVFSFVIRTNVAGIELNKFKININGIYSSEFLSGLKLYHHGVQLGSVSDVDSQGNIYLDTEGYILSAGDNVFSFIMFTDQAAKVGDIIQFSFQDANSIVLAYQNHIFTPDGSWPLVGSMTSIVDRGNIVAQNSFYKNNFLTVDGTPRLLGSFTLSNSGEIADLYSLTFSYQSFDESELSDENFLLLNNDKILAYGHLDPDKQQILFELKKPLVINNQNKYNFQLHSIALPKGTFEFYLQDVSALGFVSSQKLSLQKRVKLSQVEVLDYYPEFSVGKLKTVLSEGWNELYNLEVIARGSESIKLNKLTWALDSQGVNIEAVEFWVDNKQYMADIVLSEDKIIVKTDWEKPLAISPTSTNIKLLVKVSGLKSGANLRAHLITDQESLLDENLDSNIIWSFDGQLYSAYKLPYLPLPPSVLSY